MGARFLHRRTCRRASERRQQLARRPLEPVIVAWDGRLRHVDVRLPTTRAGRAVRYALTAEGEEPGDGTRRFRPRRVWRRRAPSRCDCDPGPAPFGGTRCGSMPAERRRRRWSCPRPRAVRSPRVAGGACSRRSTRSAPRTIGASASFSELGGTRRWVDDLGGSVTATLPLFAQFLDEPMLEPSPYSPASRLFWNETYIDVDRAPGLDRCEEARETLEDPSFRERIARLRKADLDGPSRRGRDEKGGPRSAGRAGVPRHTAGRARRLRAEPASRRLRTVPSRVRAARRLVGRVARRRAERLAHRRRDSRTTARGTTCSSSGSRRSSSPRRPPGAVPRPGA